MNICVFARSTVHHSTGGMEMHLESLLKGLSSHGRNMSVITTILFSMINGRLEKAKFNNIDYNVANRTITGQYSKSGFKN